MRVFKKQRIKKNTKPFQESETAACSVDKITTTKREKTEAKHKKINVNSRSP